MIGNDVVDLCDPDVRPDAIHPRFDRRVFAPDERRRIAAAGPDSPLRWMAWAAKEAAFKAAKRCDPACIFAPIRFLTEFDDAGRGRVHHAGVEYDLRVSLGGGCVHAVATVRSPITEHIVARVKREPTPRLAPADASRSVRAFALADLADALGVGVDSLAIRSHQRIPRLVAATDEVIALSLSHHGRCVAYACALPVPEAAA